jgi:hypothetical protein
MLTAASNRYARRASFLPSKEDPVLFIRVQRRSAATAAATLRLGLDAAAATMAALMETESTESGNESFTSLNASFFKRDPSSSMAVFRRVDESDPLVRRCSTRIVQDVAFPTSHNAVKRPCIVDAVLVEDDDDNDDESYEAFNHKRRKATLQLLESPFDPAMQASFRSTPELHAVEVSLERTFLGAQSVRQHCEMLQQLLPDTNAGFSAWTWCHSSSGNWLHAAALWDEAQVAEKYLHWLQSQQAGLSASSPQNVVASLVRAVDGEGHTPFTVAKESVHESVEKVLTTFGAEPQVYCRGDGLVDDDDDSVAYDIYCLVPSQSSSCDFVEASESDMIVDCELQDEYTGYWNGQGELVLDSSNSYGEDAIYEVSDETDDDSNEDIDTF